MAPLDDNSVPSEGTSFCVGSWIFVADGSSSFKSRPVDQNAPETSEAARRHEFDDFIDQLEEVVLSAFNSGTRIQPEFGAFRPKTLSELEVDLDKLLKDTKQETTIDGNILSSGCQQDVTEEEQLINSVSTTTIENYLKDLKEIRCKGVQS